MLFFGKSMSRSRCTGALVDALEQNDLEVRWFNPAFARRWVGRAGAIRWARRTFRSFAPDLVFAYCGDLWPELLDEFRERVPVVLWSEDLMSGISEERIDFLRRVDLLSVTDASVVPKLLEHGIDHAFFQYSGFSSRYHHPAERRRDRRDIAFIGNPGRRGQRAEFLARIADHFDVGVFGAGWGAFRDLHPRLRLHRAIDNRGYRRVCAQSRIVLGINESNDVPHYFSNRTWLTLGCRGFHLTHYVPGLEVAFARGHHLDWFRDVDEALELIDHYLRRPDERVRISEAGHRLAVDHHQYVHRVAEILRRLADREGAVREVDPDPAGRLIDLGRHLPRAAD